MPTPVFCSKCSIWDIPLSALKNDPSAVIRDWTNGFPRWEAQTQAAGFLGQRSRHRALNDPCLANASYVGCYWVHSKTLLNPI